MLCKSLTHAVGFQCFNLAPNMFSFFIKCLISRGTLSIFMEQRGEGEWLVLGFIENCLTQSATSVSQRSTLFNQRRDGQDLALQLQRSMNLRPAGGKASHKVQREQIEMCSCDRFPPENKLILTLMSLGMRESGCRSAYLFEESVFPVVFTRLFLCLCYSLQNGSHSGNQLPPRESVCLLLSSPMPFVQPSHQLFHKGKQIWAYQSSGPMPSMSFGKL